MTKMAKRLITELAAAGRPTCHFPEQPAGQAEAIEHIPEAQRRGTPAAIPALDEATLRAHFADLMSPGAASEPGGALAARAAHLPGLAHLHSRQPPATVQGVLETIHEVAHALAAMTGLERFSLQPSTLAAAERAGLLVAKAAFERTQPERNGVVAASGSAALNQARDLGLLARAVGRLESGHLDLEALDAAAGPATIAVVASWLTPHGAFERNLAAAGQVAHAQGALFCVDARGLGALVGRTRLREAGVDIAWLSLRELCQAASGTALGVRSALTEHLPSPIVGKGRGGYELDDELPNTIGPLALAPARFADVLPLYIQLRTLGAEGLRERTERLALDANVGRERSRFRFR
jgi:glycine dehydrogenase subunit 2